LNSDLVQKAHLASINTLLIFTSQDGLSSGHYNFTKIGTKMNIFHLPFTFQVESATDLNLFFVGNVGYSRTYLSDTNSKESMDTQLDTDSHIRTYTAGLGVGIRYKIAKKFTFSAGVEFIYSRSGVSLKTDNESIDDPIKDFFLQNYNDNISYKVFTELEYRPIVAEYKPYAKLSYKMYETKSEFKYDDLSKFTTASSVTELSVGAESAPVLNFGINYITLETYLNANYLSGVVSDMTLLNKFATFGAIIYYNTPEKKFWSSRYYIEGSTVQEKGLEGYNFGIGTKFAF
jgi:hypothetical protein